MQATNFRKKPVIIQAIRWDGANVDELRDFFGSLSGWKISNTGSGYLFIDTLEGGHTASPGDWIIRGVKGKYYPCKPDIFDITYEAVPEL